MYGDIFELVIYHNNGNCEYHISLHCLVQPCSLSLLTSEIIKKKRLLSTQLQENTAEIKVADRKGIGHYIIKILFQDIIKIFFRSSHKLFNMRYLQT